jgi:ferric-dicitrate binding protein FerR (iron transport regulator)
VSSSRDLLAEVLRAAGARAVPDREDHDVVFNAALDAWQRGVRAQRRRRWMLAVAASVAAMAVAVTVLVHRMTTKGPPVVATAAVMRGSVVTRSADDETWRPLTLGASITAGSHVRTASAAGLALAMPDGTSARLDKESELEVDSARSLRLTSGALYVDTGLAPAGHHPLQVETALGTVSDVGTVFQVHVRASSVRVWVREGLVQLESAGLAKALRSSAGEEVEVDDRGSVRRGNVAPGDPIWTWAEALAPPLDLDGRPLLQFLDWVAHETGRHVRFAAPDVEARAREVILHGKTRDLTPLQALDVMLSTTDLEYVLSTEQVILIRRRSG